ALGAAVALANLELFESSKLLDALPAKVELLRRHLERMAQLPNVGDVRQKGMMAGVELVRDRNTKQPFAAGLQVGARVCKHARSRGVIFRPLGDVLVLMPPLALDLALLDRLGTVMFDSIRAVCGQLRENGDEA